MKINEYIIRAKDYMMLVWSKVLLADMNQRILVVLMSNLWQDIEIMCKQDKKELEPEFRLFFFSLAYLFNCI